MHTSINNPIQRILTAVFCLLFLDLSAQNKTDIFELMERQDLKFREVEQIADQYFNTVGRGQGSGNKHFERWRYEQQFHLNDDGTYRTLEEEYNAFEQAIPVLRSKSNTRAVWSDLGPLTQNVTTSWNPGHGRCWTVAINPTNSNIIYAGTDGGGIWKTTNGGTSWVSLMDFTSSSWQSFYHIAIDPTNTNIVYAGLRSGGVIKSTNAGSTWFATGSGPSSIKRIRIHPTNGNFVFATGSNGIYRSGNGGTTWTQVKTGSTEDIHFRPENSNIMYASTNSSATFWRSTDRGLNWTNITTGITNSGRTLIGVSNNNPNLVYLLQASGSVFGRLYKSTDGGSSFTTTVVGGASTNYFGYEPDGTGTSGQATHDMAITVNPFNANEVHIAGIICWKSINGGASFTATTDWTWNNTFGYNHADVHSLVYQGTTLYSSSDGGIWKSNNNAADWTDISSNMGTRQFYRLACAKNHANVISGGAQDNGSVYRTTSSVWNEWLGADGMDAIISPTSSGTGIGTSQYGSIYRTTNYGATLSYLTKPTNGNWVTPLCWHPTSGTTVYGGWDGVYQSTNTGTSWTKISGTTITGNVECLVVAPSDANYIYASDGSTLYYTTDGGTTWASSTAAAATISSICVSPLNPSKIWVTTTSSSNNVKVSTNNGTTFTNISAGLPSVAARSVAVENNTNENLYVGMNIGVYYRNNVNPGWVEHATGLPLVAVNEVEVQQSGGKLRVATYGRGIWESPLKSISAKENISIQEYCEVQTKSTEEWIEQVQFGQINHISGNNAGYSSCKDQITAVAVNHTYPLTVKPGFKRDAYKENWMVFIDYNQDGDFNDEHEKVARFVKHDEEAYTHNFSISTSAKIGYTTMRIVMLFNGESDGCSVSQGEVEDYIIHIGSTTTGDETATESEGWLDNFTKDKLTLYPNPTRDKLVVEFTNEGEATTATLRMVDMKGEVVQQQEISLLPGINSIRLSTEGLASGNYFVHIRNHNFTYTGQLSVIR
jgi:hypothetical protein